jgi:Bax protein
MAGRRIETGRLLFSSSLVDQYTAVLKAVNLNQVETERNMFATKLTSVIRTSVSRIVTVVRWIAKAISRFVRSDTFRHGVSRAGNLIISAAGWIIAAAKWIVVVVGRFSKSEAVRYGIGVSARFFDRIQRKAGQKNLMLAGVCLLVVVLVLWAVRPGIPDFAEYAAGSERKQAFFSYFLPLIGEENQAIQRSRLELLEWYRNRDSIGWWDEDHIQEIATRYRIENFDIDSDTDWQTLLRRVDIVPPSLALAQAANESAWGTSRFARQAHNYYGQWCFEKGCGIVPDRRDANKSHEVAAFDSPRESVAMYLHNLNSNSAYKSLRDIRSQLKAANKPVTSIALAAGLGKYSERGADYISELRSMIEFNKLSKYDSGLGTSEF